MNDDLFNEMKRDIDDLFDLCDAERCNLCKRYKTKGLICPHCGHDNSGKED